MGDLSFLNCRSCDKDYPFPCSTLLPHFSTLEPPQHLSSRIIGTLGCHIPHGPSLNLLLLNLIYKVTGLGRINLDKQNCLREYAYTIEVQLGNIVSRHCWGHLATNPRSKHVICRPNSQREG